MKNYKCHTIVIIVLSLLHMQFGMIQQTQATCYVIDEIYHYGELKGGCNCSMDNRPYACSTRGWEYYHRFYQVCLEASEPDSTTFGEKYEREIDWYVETSCKQDFIPGPLAACIGSLVTAGLAGATCIINPLACTSLVYSLFVTGAIGTMTGCWPCIIMRCLPTDEVVYTQKEINCLPRSMEQCDAEEL